MEKTSLAWMRAQIDMGKIDPADVAALCDRLEYVERLAEGLMRENEELRREVDLREGEYFIALTDEQLRQVHELFDIGKLAYEQEHSLVDLEFHDAFEYFIDGAIEVQYDLYVTSEKIDWSKIPPLSPEPKPKKPLRQSMAGPWSKVQTKARRRRGKK